MSFAFLDDDNAGRLGEVEEDGPAAVGDEEEFLSGERARRMLREDEFFGGGMDDDDDHHPRGERNSPANRWEMNGKVEEKKYASRPREQPKRIQHHSFPEEFELPRSPGAYFHSTRDARPPLTDLFSDLLLSSPAEEIHAAKNTASPSRLGTKRKRLTEDRDGSRQPSSMRILLSSTNGNTSFSRGTTPRIGSTIMKGGGAVELECRAGDSISRKFRVRNSMSRSRALRVEIRPATNELAAFPQAFSVPAHGEREFEMVFRASPVLRREESEYLIRLLTTPREGDDDPGNDAPLHHSQFVLRVRNLPSPTAREGRSIASRFESVSLAPSSPSKYLVPLVCSVRSIAFGKVDVVDGARRHFSLKNLHPSKNIVISVRVERTGGKASCYTLYRYAEAGPGGKERARRRAPEAVGRDGLLALVLHPGEECDFRLDLLPLPGDTPPTRYACAIAIVARLETEGESVHLVIPARADLALL